MTGWPRVVVLSAPSGGGKTTIAKAVRERHPERFGFSISATTRRPRPGERHGIDYHFWDRDRFRAEIVAGKFLEHAEYAGELYGTLRAEVDRIRAQGRHVLLDIEVDGAAQVRALEPDAVTVFILPSEPRVLLERLTGRQSESAAEVERRLERATYELSQAMHFHRLIRNDDLETAVRDVVQAVADGETVRRSIGSSPDFAWINNYVSALQQERARMHAQKG
ncbi:MAG: guanylate kinase [Gemmatimonadales bacterium]|nr:guanylate kinase [Gemmatimonadales bacterium]